jgi:hypothetical protein
MLPIVKRNRKAGEMTAHALRKLSILAFLAGLASGAYGLTVCVAPAQEKAFAPVPEGAGSPVGYLVDGCMSALFDAGHVATDEDTAMVRRGDWGERDYGLAGAKEGLVDYVIALFVEWAPSSIHKEAILPVTVDYRLVRVRDGRVLAEGSVPGSADSEDASTHAARTASRAGASAGAACIEKLSALGMGGES